MLGYSNALEGTFGKQNSTHSPTARCWRAWAKCEPTMNESSRGLSSSPRSITHSSAAKAASTTTTISCPSCQSLPRRMQAAGRQDSTPLRIALSISYGPAGYALWSRRGRRLRITSQRGRADEWQQQPVMHPSPYVMVSGPVEPLDPLPGVLTPHLESHRGSRHRRPPKP